jgi:hypothetical protein
MKSAGAVKLADLTELTPKLIPAEGETLIVLTDKPCRTLKCVLFGSLFCVLLVERSVLGSAARLSTHGTVLA